jgi:hypothetical protein
VTQVANSRAFSFIGGAGGDWSVLSQRTLSGAPIATVQRIAMVKGMPSESPSDAAWMFRGVATNDRYTTASEKAALSNLQVPIGRVSSTRAALILMRKTDAWWALAQDERRAILEEESHHIAIGMKYLPAVSRRLLHCRDLGSDEQFDFIGFLDYAATDEPAFDEMIARLRSTREWSFMEREIDIRLEKAHSRSE